MMGAGVGLTMGFLFGGFSILRYVPRLSRCATFSHHLSEEVPALVACSRHSRNTCLVALQRSPSFLPSVRYVPRHPFICRYRP